MKIFNGMNVTASALTAERIRMDVIAGNIANIDTTRTPEGGPYRRKIAVFEERLNRELEALTGGVARCGGVALREIREDMSPFRVVHDPRHPDADEQGFVKLPNVDILTEIVDMMAATRAYEANVTVFNSQKAMANKAMEIGRG